jgi:DNA invertase Pin-like site-specific DNA recombinase
MSRRAAIYARISQDREGAGLGIDRQEQDCRELAARLGWTVVAVHADNDLSASSGRHRPGYAALLADLRGGQVDAVIAWHTDRLHRRPLELEEYIAVCEPRQVPTATVKAGPLDLSTPSGRMVARQLGAVARFEVEHAADRQRRAREQAAKDGRWAGGRRPYGYAAGGMTVLEAEAAEVLAACQAVLAGDSLRALATDLNRRGRRTATGRPWTPVELRRVLLRPRNAGLAVYRGEEVGPACWPAIVPEGIWRALVAILIDQARRTSPGPGRRWLLSGLALCGVCARPMVAGSVGRARGQAVRPAYTCKTGKHVVRDAHAVDKLVTAIVLERLRRPDARDLLAADAPADTSALHARAVALRCRLNGLATAYAADQIDGAQLAHGSAQLRGELGEVERAIAAAARTSPLAGVADAPDPAKVWKGLGLDRRRAVVDTLLHVTILRARRGRRPGWRPGEPYFDPASVRVEPRR